MWAGKDNGRDINWRKAMKYCDNLRSAGYSDWRLATIDELQGIYDKSAEAPGLAGKHDDEPSTFHVKGNLFLTGEALSSTPVRDDRGRPPEFGWYLNFSQGSPIYEKLSFTTGERALCVRSTAAAISGAQPSAVRAYWIDPSTGLMWAGKDNGEDLNWHGAIKYCLDLRLAGYSDWRLATLHELQGIYDKNAESPGENPRSHWHATEPMTFHVKGNLFLTGTQWTSTQLLDDRGEPSGYAWRFDFNEGFPFDGDELWFFTDKHALCVRGSEK